MSRPSWDEYFLSLAKAVAARGTCDRKRVGAVIVMNNHIIATGYNGAPKGLDHCDDVGHLMVHGHCMRVVHAECNAIAQAAMHGAKTDGATIYVTASPCSNCMRLIVNAGIVRVVYGEFYRDQDSIELADKANIELVHYVSVTG